MRFTCNQPKEVENIQGVKQETWVSAAKLGIEQKKLGVFTHQTLDLAPRNAVGNGEITQKSESSHVAPIFLVGNHLKKAPFKRARFCVPRILQFENDWFCKLWKIHLQWNDVRLLAVQPSH